ncbi:MAG TPA: hypothetical protein VI818_05175 [Candidatus Thermoplasmatota archaeon]|nr:hypothetical protein [Candidatus Thermoplasmatota archaeon]
MTEYVYVGRRRHPVKVLVYQLLTLGVYGRVLLYKMLREFDGHEALFLDRRPYILLLILPFIGPFLVKRRIAHLLEDTVHHDVTTKVPSRRRLLLIALIPLAPWYHWIVQQALNHHWKMHTKEEELALKQGQLAALERKSRTKENLEAAHALRKEVSLRTKELDDLRAAAIALREAEEVRRAAERDLARSGARRRKLSMGMVRKMLPAAAFRRRGTPHAEAVPEQPPGGDAGDESPVDEDAGQTDAATEPTVDAGEAPQEKSASGRGLFRFLRRAGPRESKEERKARKQREKEAKREQKEADREAQRAAKEAAAEKDAPKPKATPRKPHPKKGPKKGR